MANVIGVGAGGVKALPSLQMAAIKAKEYGLRLTSGYRSPADDKRVGGTGSGDHTRGLALDFAGSNANMDKFAKWAKASGMFRIVLWQTAGHYDHVHVAARSSEKEGDKTYKVVKGDTLSEIAAKFGLSWKKLAEYNNINNPNVIKEGQVLKIPVFFT